MDEDPRYPRPDRSLAELGRGLDRLERVVDFHHGPDHVTRREFDALITNQRRLYWIIITQLVVMVGLIISTALAGWVNKTLEGAVSAVLVGVRTVVAWL